MRINKDILIGDTTTTLEQINTNKTNIESINTYSTSEKAIGTWVDGKTIYQKTIPFTFSSSANSVSIAHGITNIDKCIKYYGSFLESGNVIRFIPQFYYTMDSVYSIVVYIIDATNINIYYGDYAKNNTSIITDCYITIEYTKK
jgi:hypothetical protein